ncbi:hypothetical protein HYFRA_00009314 [Hymenoscyphus fraxineus]|uniref:GPI mannosyltransferase 2 n=1 Tax=Hymenoscyphus fraxineus TaxID=746836 RepID=A0A9N9PVV5_9HELO|nr:hypothetical protein HYFRA_00009314 [Hymenoscyphus fraxineus]
MSGTLSATWLLHHPLRSLVVLFAVWKTFLLLIACCSPGEGYDTSTSLIMSPLGGNGMIALPTAFRYLAKKLTRWDAIYFIQTSSRGYLFEQEWAFGWGFTRLIHLFASVLREVGVPSYNGLESCLAILIAHSSHLFSVLCLFKLTFAVFPDCTTKFAFTSAALHILSPAGLFLSAPYAESSCALLSFAGCLVFIASLANDGQESLGHDLLVIVSGVLFAIATTFRSNGILNGLLLLQEAVRTLLKLSYGLRLATVRRLLFTGFGGLVVGGGLLVPQYIAWSEYCTELEVEVLRPWCNRTVPSIYAFVQDHYWNVGLFRYWTVSNVPLFLLAAPMSILAVVSGIWASAYVQEPKSRASTNSGWVIKNMAISQLLLTMITWTSAHVQIITRISSSFPVWVWYIATLVQKNEDLWGGNAVRYMVMYAVIQGGLFASFLPPA